jgi:hypothetical protein
MCGIVGVISKSPQGLYKTHADTFYQLLWADQLRGTDGTGMFFNLKDQKVHMLKQPGGAVNLFTQKGYDKAIAATIKDGNFLIGHNRAATKGKKIWQDTHPFIEKHICLIHNGTLLQHKNLANADVDSQAIAIHMAEHGTEKTLENIEGAFALVWADMEEGTLNLARNRERPLHLIETTFFWIVSSEKGLGEWIAERNNHRIEKTIMLTPGKVYSFDIKGNNYEKYTVKDVKIRGTFMTTTSQNYYHHGAAKQDLTLPQRQYMVKLYYGLDELVRFRVIENPDDPTTCIKHHHVFQTDYVCGEMWENTHKHKIQIFGTEKQLQEYQEDFVKNPLIVYEGKVISFSSKAVGAETYTVDNVDYAFAPSKVIGQKVTQIESIIDKKDEDPYCMICDSTIWPNQIQTAVKEKNGNYTCRACAEEWNTEHMIGLC